MCNDNKKETWKWVINLIVSILTALAASLGTSSCVQQVAGTCPIYGETPVIRTIVPEIRTDFASDSYPVILDDYQNPAQDDADPDPNEEDF